MGGMVKAGMEQHNQEKLFLLNTRLHLTPEQEAAVKVAMDQEGKLGLEMLSKMSAGKTDPHDPQTMADIKAMSQGIKSVDQTLNEILTPEQKRRV